MKTTLKRLFSLLMVLVMVGSMMPAVYADSTPAQEPVDEAIALTDEDYAIVNDVFAQIDAMEDAPAKKSASRTQITDAAAQIVMASENYVEGSLERNGNSFTWWTDEGIRCIYNPYMREKYDNMQAPADPEPAGIYNAPKATKGGWPSGNQVYLIAPYYGIDDSFTDQYKNEAKAIASAIGDTDGYTLYSGSSVTVDSVADAIENGAVVIFDSHGTTDYDGSYVCDDPDGYEVYDYVSKAKYSYLCLTNKSGLTTADYNAGATYFTDSEGIMCACINGAAIANHMDKNSPSGLLWMAICLGMATDTMCEPMREKGVEVVYGYSQSVTFAGDYCFEETFWDNMTAGKDVATSIAAMKSKWGNWDWSEPIAASYGYSGSGYTLAQARQYRSAFPIVVSDEDAHPGQRDSGTNYGACSEQTVKSTYTLYSQYNVTAKSNNNAWGTVSANGSTITASPASGYFAQGYTVLNGTATVTQNGNTFSVAADSDCTIQINFAAKTAVTVNFSGANVSGQTGYAGDAMALPTAEAPEGYKFLGWMTAPLSGDTTEKPSYYTDSFIPTGNTTLYALYSYVDSASGGGSGDYVKVTETPADWSGEYLIVYEAGSRVFDGSLATLEAVSNYQDVTISDNTISADEADAYKFIIAAMDGGYSIQSASGMYISGTSGSNKLNQGTSPAANTISIDASGNADIVSNTSHLRYNATSGQDRFRYYKSTSYSSQKAIALYVKDGSAGTTYYTTSLCDHENVKEVAAVAATCTEAGYTAGTQCVDCGSYVTGHEVVAALGHNWSDWDETTAPGCETAGEQTHTCSACGETETQSVAATGHSWNSGVITTAATCTANGVKTFTCSACGATQTEDIPVLDHNYENGICTGCGAAEPVGPVLPKNGDQVVIYAPAYNKALSSTYTSFYNQGVDVSVANGVVTGYGDTEIWKVIANSDGTYSFAYDGQNLGMEDSYSSMPLGGVNDDWNIISLGDGLYNIQNAARGKYIEWYTEKDNWSTYDSDFAATDDRFQLSFYIISEVEDPEESLPEESEPLDEAYVKITSADQLVSGQYVMVVSTGYAPGVVSGTWLTAVTPTISGDVVTDAAGGVWTLTVEGSSVTLTDSNGVSIAPKGGNNNGLATGQYAWAWSFADGTFTFAGTGSDTVKLASNTASDNMFRGYKDTTVTDASKYPSQFTLYKLSAEVTNQINGMAMVLGDDLNVIFNVNMNEDSQLVITVADQTYTFNANQLSATVNGSYDAYIPIAAAQMADEITVKFVTGETESESSVYTVKRYADYILTDINNEFTDKDKALVQAMLNYGGAAQTYFGYDTENLVSTEFGTQTPETNDEMGVTDTSADINFYGASLIFRERIAVRFYFTGNVEGKLFTVQGKEVNAMQKDGLYYVEIGDIMPYELGQQYTVTADGISVTYGPLNYIVRMYERGNDTTKNLMQALYNYYLVALDYVTAE